MFTPLSYPRHSSSRQAYTNKNISSESKFPEVNRHITIQGHQQNAAEAIGKLINVNTPQLCTTRRLNTAQVEGTK
jgi:hypothetical protein